MKTFIGKHHPMEVFHGGSNSSSNDHDSSPSEATSSPEKEIDAEFDEAVALEKDRNFIEYDIVTMIPRDRKPKRLIHVTVVDGLLMYLVQWKKDANDSDLEEEVNAKNSSIVNARIFRPLFPQMVISFYESRILKIKPLSHEELALKACHALVQAQESKSKTVSSSNDDDLIDSVNEYKETYAPQLDKFGLPIDMDSSTSEDSD